MNPLFWNIWNISLRKNLGFGIYFSGKFAQNGIFHENIWSKRFVFPANHWDAARKTDATWCQLLENYFGHILRSFGQAHGGSDTALASLNEFQSKCLQLRTMTMTMTKQSSLTDYVTRKINWFLINPVEWVEISKPPVME